LGVCACVCVLARARARARARGRMYVFRVCVLVWRESVFMSTCACVRACVCARVRACMRVCVHAYALVRMCVCVCVCVSGYMRVCAHVRPYARACVCGHASGLPRTSDALQIWSPVLSSFALAPMTAVGSSPPMELISRQRRTGRARTKFPSGSKAPGRRPSSDAKPSLPLAEAPPPPSPPVSPPAIGPPPPPVSAPSGSPSSPTPPK
jgi:hypothetical protein